MNPKDRYILPARETADNGFIQKGLISLKQSLKKKHALIKNERRLKELRDAHRDALNQVANSFEL